MEPGEYGMKPYLLRLVACLFLCVSLNSFGAQVFEINNAYVKQIFSPAFDGNYLGQSVIDDGSFFGNVPNIDNYQVGVNRTSSISNLSEDVSGEISFDGDSISLFINFDTVQATVDIPQSGRVLQVDLHSFTFTLPVLNDAGDHINFDAGGEFSSGNTSEIGFFPSLFDNDSTDQLGYTRNCIANYDPVYGGQLCSFVNNIVGTTNASRIIIDGNPSESGGDDFLLMAGTPYNGYFEIAFSTSEVPLPAGIYLFLSGLVGLGLMRGKRSK